MRGGIWAIILASFCSQLWAQGRDIKIEIDNYNGDVILLAAQLGDQTFVMDSLELKDGVYQMPMDDIEEEGVYLIVTPPKNENFQLFVNKNEPGIDIKVDFKDFIGSLQERKPGDNSLFNDYIKFLGQQRKAKETLFKNLDEGKDSIKVNRGLDSLDALVRNKQGELVRNHPKSITSLWIKSTEDVTVPVMEELPASERQVKRFNYYRNHFFDHIDFNDLRLKRMPFFHGMVKEYMEKMTVQHPDSLINTVDFLLNKMESNEPLYKYYLSSFLNKYASSNIMGLDAIYVHLAKNYYGTGKAPWMEQENIDKIVEDAQRLNYTLIGKEAPDFYFEEIGSDRVFSLHTFEAPYTLLIFWSPTCSHCKKEMPLLPELLKTHQDIGLKAITISTKSKDLVKEYFEEKKIDVTWLSGLLRSNVTKEYDLRVTPKIFILDKDKKIIMKNVALEQLQEVLHKVIKEHERRQ